MSFPIDILRGYRIVSCSSTEHTADLTVKIGDGGIRALVLDILDRIPGTMIVNQGRNQYAIQHAGFTGVLTASADGRSARLAVQAPEFDQLRDVSQAPGSIAFFVKQQTDSTMLALAAGGLAALALDPIRKRLSEDLAGHRSPSFPRRS